MSLVYHASPTAGIENLEPRISNHGVPRVYFSEKRENVLPYLSNAVEKFCRETGFAYDGPWEKWGPYGFTKEGLLRLEEYYPNALEDTYKGVSAYIYRVEKTACMQALPGIHDAVFSEEAVEVKDVEFIADAYEEILKAHGAGLIEILRYEDGPQKWREWSEQTILAEYEAAESHPEYRYFIREKFSWVFGK